MWGSRELRWVRNCLVCSALWTRKVSSTYLSQILGDWRRCLRLTSALYLQWYLYSPQSDIGHPSPEGGMCTLYCKYSPPRDASPTHTSTLAPNCPAIFWHKIGKPNFFPQTSRSIVRTDIMEVCLYTNIYSVLLYWITFVSFSHCSGIGCVLHSMTVKVSNLWYLFKSDDILENIYARLGFGHCLLVLW